MKVLLVYFSHGGATRELVEKIHDSLGTGEIVELKYKRKCCRAFSFLRYGYQSTFKKNVKLEEIKTKEPLTKYDMVIIGSPVWAGKCSAPVRTFLQLHGKTLQRTATVITHGSNGPMEKVLGEIDSLTGQRRLTALDIPKDTINADELVRAFVAALVVSRNT